MEGNEVDIAKNIKALEWLKAELLTETAHLFKAMLKGSTEKILEILALIILLCYFVAKRLGSSFGQLDFQVQIQLKKILEPGHPLEEGYGDVSSLQKYFQMKR